jgi:hypothetical protein
MPTSSGISPELLLAILAMDSYNRGYDPGLALTGIQIGSANLLTDSSQKLGLEITSAAGFYAAAYTLADGTVVISYRGTDAAPDYTKGWVIAAGRVDASGRKNRHIASLPLVAGLSHMTAKETSSVTS